MWSLQKYERWRTVNLVHDGHHVNRDDMSGHHQVDPYQMQKHKQKINNPRKPVDMAVNLSEENCAKVSSLAVSCGSHALVARYWQSKWLFLARNDCFWPEMLLLFGIIYHGVYLIEHFCYSYVIGSWVMTVSVNMICLISALFCVCIFCPI